jgi:hypothetical protein
LGHLLKRRPLAALFLQRHLGTGAPIQVAAVGEIVFDFQNRPVEIVEDRLDLTGILDRARWEATAW